MLQDAYPFTFVQREQGDNEGIEYIDLYHFKSTKSHLWYIVRVEYYTCHIYGVKFYPKNFRLSPDKYRLMTNTFEPRRIINTCINVMLQVYDKDSKASFGFIGANGINEDIRYTRRFRFYSHIVATYFDNTRFTHKENTDKSTYMLINNKAWDENPHLVSDIENFFAERYDYFD